MNRLIYSLALAATLSACSQDAPPPAPPAAAPEASEASPASDRYGIYTDVRLEVDLSHLSDGQRRMLGLLIEASDILDDLFWHQAWGDRESLLARIDDPDQRRFAEINYGPWDRLAGNAPFVDGIGRQTRRERISIRPT